MGEHLSIRELTRPEMNDAADLVARAMQENPLNIAAFGANPTLRAARVQRMFRILLPTIHRKGFVLGAVDGGGLVGIAASMPSSRCQPSASEKLVIAARILQAVGPVGFVRMLRWTQVWAAHDEDLPHWHLGPVAVDAHLQGGGIGSTLMSEYCRRLDRAAAIGYLETDKGLNTRFYTRFGFRTAGETSVLEVPNWFMRRPAAATCDEQSRRNGRGVDTRHPDLRGAVARELP